MTTGSNQAAAAEKGIRLRRLASSISLFAAILLVAVKLFAWVMTGSVALLSSAMDALVDTVAALATFYGVRFAARPPDEDHRFGHGKGEAIAGFTQAAFLAGAGLALACESVGRFAFPQPVQKLGIGLIVIIAGLVAAIGLVGIQTWVLRQTRSTAIAADRAHYLTDVAVNVAVLLAFVIMRLTGTERADSVAAFGISGYMLWNSRHIAMTTLQQLLDKEIPDDYRQRIMANVLACRDVRGIHDLRTRYAGDRIFIQFHLEVDADLTVARGHAICDTVETEVQRLFSTEVEVSTHLEPAGIEDERLDYQISHEPRH